MAHMNQEIKVKLVTEARKVLKKYGVSATFSTGRGSIYCNIKSGPIDFFTNYKETVRHNPYYTSMLRCIDVKDYMQINPYHFQNHFTGPAKDFLADLIKALNIGNWDNSDIQTDYFDVGWYVTVNVGRWKKPYRYTLDTHPKSS